MSCKHDLEYTGWPTEHDLEYTGGPNKHDFETTYRLSSKLGKLCIQQQQIKVYFLLKFLTCFEVFKKPNHEGDIDG